MKKDGWLRRLEDESAQVWAVTVKDVKVHYRRPGIIMFGLVMPFFLFSPSRSGGRWAPRRESPDYWR